MIRQTSIPGIGGTLVGELIIDLFAGGGGASHGIEMALGRPPDIAINHDPAAVQMHAANHPATRHFCESIYDVSPRAVTGGQAVGLLWASPSCTHFSRARGSTPVSKQERGLGWMILRWAALTGARCIVAENVAEWETWGPVRKGRPLKKQAGKYFLQLVGQLRDLGYSVEWRTINAADHGAPTNRKRLFLVARRDGLPVVWPTASHGPGAAQPCRTAAQCIDWSDLGKSIFTRTKPLATATCRRIAAGLVRFVLSGKPFLVEIDNRSNGLRAVRDIGDPLTTITTENRHALVAAFLAKHYTGVIGHPVTQPLGTITTVDHHSLVAAHLVTLRNNCIGQPAAQPLGTITAGGNHAALCTAFLTTYYSGGGTASSCAEPVPTIVTKARHGLVTVDVDGTTYALADIRLRMLKPRELAQMQGFPKDYQLTGTQVQQIGRIGNSVSPYPAAAIVRANVTAAHQVAA